MTQQLLDQLAELYAQRDLASLEKQRLIDNILTQEIKAQIADIEAEFSGKNETVNDAIANLEAQIKEVVQLGVL